MASPASLSEGLELRGGWVLGDRIGGGAFSDVYAGTRDMGDGEVFALKLAPLPAPTTAAKKKRKKVIDGATKICWEATVYRNLLKRHPSLPRVPGNYADSKGYRFLAVERLGVALDSLLVEHGQLPVATVAKLGAQMVDVLRHIHANSILHRDVKPANFMLGAGTDSAPAGRVFCVDFGEADKYIDYKGAHKPFSKNESPVGTPGFMSANVLRGYGAWAPPSCLSPPHLLSSLAILGWTSKRALCTDERLAYLLLLLMGPMLLLLLLLLLPISPSPLTHDLLSM